MNIRVKEAEIPNQCNFLIAEDMEHVREIIYDHLRDSGFIGDIKFAETEPEAQSEAKHSNVNFFILDWNLKQGSGHDLIRWLRRQPRYAKTPILMVTGKDDVEDMLSAMESGANAYLIKPWTLEELEEKMSDAWKDSKES
ncbi:MAG: hypothetical protein Fur0010_27110 [Bdellovibrio sp.]